MCLKYNIGNSLFNQPYVRMTQVVKLYLTMLIILTFTDCGQVSGDQLTRNATEQCHCLRTLHKVHACGTQVEEIITLQEEFQILQQKSYQLRNEERTTFSSTYSASISHCN
jgi:hypothetical protein